MTSPDEMTPTAMGHNPRLILGRPVLPMELVRGLQGTTRNLAMWSREGDGTAFGLVGREQGA